MSRYWIVFWISMLPLVELRGAIPYSAMAGLDPLRSYLVAIVGNMLPVPVIFFFARRVLVWGSKQAFLGAIFQKILQKGEQAGAKLEAKAGLGLYLALLLFVGIPLPGTGAWTGTLAASLLGMDFKKSSLACMSGVMLAGILMALASQGLAALLF